MAVLICLEFMTKAGSFAFIETTCNLITCYYLVTIEGIIKPGYYFDGKFRQYKELNWKHGVMTEITIDDEIEELLEEQD